MREIITRTERIERDESGIISCKVFKVLVNVEDAKENVKAVHVLAGDRLAAVYVDITEAAGVTKEARAYLASDEVAKVQCACALLVNSALSRLTGQFFLGLNKTKFPIKLFQDEHKAKEWLKTFL